MQEVKQYRNIKEVFQHDGYLYLLGEDLSLSRIMGAEKEARLDLSDYGGKIDPRKEILQIFYNKTLFQLSGDLVIRALDTFEAEHVSKIGDRFYYENRVDRNTRHSWIIEGGKTVFDRTWGEWIRSIGRNFYWQEAATQYGLTRIDLSTGKDGWSYDIRESGRYYNESEQKWYPGSIIANHIESRKGKLIFYATQNLEGDLEGRQYVALDEHAGSLVWNLRDVTYGSGQIEFYGDDIISMAGRKVLVIDSNTGMKKALVDFEDRIDKAVFIYNAFRVFNNKLVFCESRRKKTIGLINLDSWELEHLFEAQIKAFQIESLHATDNYICIKDSDNIVHFYELG